MMGKPAKILFASMLVAILSISVTGYVYADSITYSKGAVSQHADQVIYYASLSSTADTISISWEEPEDEPKDYRVAWAPHNGDYVTYRNMDYNAFPTDSSYTITDLEEDTKYKIKIRARYHEAPPGPWTLDIPLRTESVVSTPDPQPTPDPEPTPDPDPESEDHTEEMMQMQTELNEAMTEINRLINLISRLQTTLDSMMPSFPSQLPQEPDPVETPVSYITLNTTSARHGDTILVTGKLFPEFNSRAYPNDIIHYANGTIIKLYEQNEDSVRTWWTFELRAPANTGCHYNYHLEDDDDNGEVVFYTDEDYTEHEHDGLLHVHELENYWGHNHTSYHIIDHSHRHWDVHGMTPCTFNLDDYTFSMEFTIVDGWTVGDHRITAIINEDYYGENTRPTSDRKTGYLTVLPLVS